MFCCIHSGMQHTYIKREMQYLTTWAINNKKNNNFYS